MDRRDDDQIRADVERALHDVVGLFLAVPQAFARLVRQCVATSVDRAGAPVQVLRSLADLTVGRVVSPVEDEIGSPRPDGPHEPLGAPAASGAAPVDDEAQEVPEIAEPLVEDSEEAGEPADVRALPIDQYESLAASHVVARLPALTPDELRTVRAFETAHRGRRTVVGKIDQLLAAGG